ncbi:hypothetical protein ACFUN7_06315 [Streptomyces sp. NPDC057236]|uniref:hypothetical protein n=1 Tax=Streptomyces sp. NPDC057236 TaxID=3346059 RepID=UPI00363EE2DD
MNQFGKAFLFAVRREQRRQAPAGSTGRLSGPDRETTEQRKADCGTLFTEHGVELRAAL